MVVPARGSPRGRSWADHALERIGEVAGAIGVSLSTAKTRVVTLADLDAVLAFVGFDFRWTSSVRTGAR